MIEQVTRRFLLTAMLLPLLLVCIAATVSAESWPRETRTTYLRLGMRGFDSDGYYNASGHRVDVHCLQAQTYALYSEYSYSRYVAAIVDVPAYRRLQVQERAEGDLNIVEAPGDINLGLRIAMLPGTADAVYLKGMFSIPIGETSNDHGLWSGDDEYDQLISAGYMHRFAPMDLTVSLEGGYHFRSEGYSDELVFAADASIRPVSSLEFAVRARLVRSERNGAEGFTGGRYGFAANNQEYVAVGPDLTFWFTRGFGLNAAVYSYSSAKNMPSALTFSTGVVFLFHPMTEH